MKPIHKDPSNNFFKSKDIYISSILQLHNIPLVRVETLNGGRCIFVFQHIPDLDDLIAKFFNKQLRVEPQSLFETWKGLKALAYSTTNNIQ